MTQSPPPAKCARLSDDAPGTTSSSMRCSLTDFKHHSDFWFDDGNLILVTKQGVAFRVYRGLLAAQSTFFAEKVADPKQIFQECPVVEVSDTPEELAHFLRVMLPKSTQLFYRRKDDPPFTFDQVAAVIRLSHKYKVEDVLMQALELLQERHFSTDYIAWQQRKARPNILAQDGHIAIGAVNLARLTGTTSILPAAIYECVRLAGAVLDGWTRDDGVVEYLAPQDLKLCLDARDALYREAAGMFLRVFDVGPCAECVDPELCRIHLHDARQDTFSEYFPDHPSFDLETPKVLEGFLRVYDFCDECRRALFMRESQERHNLWGRLPDLLEAMTLVVSPSTPPVMHSPTVADAGASQSCGDEYLTSGPNTSSGSLHGPLAGIQRHPELWIEDGNLILVANRHTAFRIYTGLLTSQSEIFANMFAVASSSASAGETYEGCPVVPVYDTPAEFAHFLHVLVPKESRTFHRTAKGAPTTFDQAAVVLRLAHKYGLPDIRNQALALLADHAFPASGPRAPEAPLAHPTLVVHDPNAIGAASLARLVDKPALLLPALHRCVALGSAVLGGWTRDDGHVEHLARADLRLCMDAHRALVRARVALFVMCAYDDDPHPDCATPEQCGAGLRAVEDAMLREEFLRPSGCAALDGWETGVGERAGGCGLCGCCRGMLEDRDREARRDAWARLPAIFGIEVAEWCEGER